MSVTTSAKEILARTAAGPDGLPEAFWELVERYRGELVNQAYAILGSLPDAEDVVQESLCEAFNNRKRLVEARSLGALLRSINLIWFNYIFLFKYYGGLIHRPLLLNGIVVSDHRNFVTVIDVLIKKSSQISTGNHLTNILKVLR